MGMQCSLNEAAVVARIVLTGKLQIVSPLCIGDGAGESAAADTIDVHVQKNKQGKPFIPGTSIAGVIRSLLRARIAADALLFGSSDESGHQSVLQFFDTVFDDADIAYRDGVAIHAYRGTAVKGSKYDYEVVDAGSGILRLEAIIREGYGPREQEIRQAVLIIRDLLRHGVQFGAMTAKGMGLVQLHDDSIGCYNLAENKADVKKWFMKPEADGRNASDQMLDEVPRNAEIQNPTFEGEFELRGTMIVRTANMDEAETDNKHIDAVFLKNSKGQYVVPGTSLKGVLRNQAEYILGRLWEQDKQSMADFINKMMGYASDNNHKQKSRFYVAESILNEAVESKIVTRNRIDRITGGVMDSSLFTTVPVYQKQSGVPAMKIRFFIKPAKGEDDNAAEIGLALLLFRDLWQGRIAIGGEKGIGRGTLRGIRGTITLSGIKYTIDADGRISSDSGDISALDQYVQSLVKEG